MSSTTSSSPAFASFAEFYPFYLGEHSNRSCRRLHFVGTTLVIAAFAAALTTGNIVWLLLMPLFGYGFAWVGHFYFEKNKPATFKYPVYSLIGDFCMYRDIWLGRIAF
jgi:hypothetical protein